MDVVRVVREQGRSSLHGRPDDEQNETHVNVDENDAEVEMTTVRTVSRVNVVPVPHDASANADRTTNNLPPNLLLPRRVGVDSETLNGDYACSHNGGIKGRERVPRKWEFFPGKNQFYCDGRIITAPSIRFCILSFALILLTFSLFIVFDAPFLTQKLTFAIPIVGSLLFVSVIVNMAKTSFTDPGILPRASQQEAEYLEKIYYTTNARPPPRTKDIIVNGHVIKSKYCFTCKMFRPPRASHCGVCDNCVDRFDHHCPFLGNCIGKRNYRNFYAFILSLSFLAVFVLSASIAHLAMLSKEKGNFLMALQESPSSAVVILISFFGMWTVIGLTGFHTYLIAVEQTTNEDIKGLFGKANVKNPFSQGNVCENCCYILCGPYQPSLIDPRGLASHDFLSSIPKKGGPTGVAIQARLSNTPGANVGFYTGLVDSACTFQNDVRSQVDAPQSPLTDLQQCKDGSDVQSEGSQMTSYNNENRRLTVISSEQPQPLPHPTAVSVSNLFAPLEIASKANADDTLGQPKETSSDALIKGKDEAENSRMLLASSERDGESEDGILDVSTLNDDLDMPSFCDTKAGTTERGIDLAGEEGSYLGTNRPDKNKFVKPGKKSAELNNTRDLPSTSSSFDRATQGSSKPFGARRKVGDTLKVKQQDFKNKVFESTMQSSPLHLDTIV